MPPAPEPAGRPASERDLYLRELLAAAPPFTADQERDLHTIVHSPTIDTRESRETA